MENIKSINVVWLSKANLSNINAGDRSGNVTELKTYDKGRKPYASGQSVRHALRQSIERAHPSDSPIYKCVPELPCGNVKDCWLCDLFGYLNPKKGEGSDRRWSVLKVSPALGQIRKDIVTDKLTRDSIQETKENEGKYEEITKLEEKLKEEKEEEKIAKINEEIKKIRETIKKSKDQRVVYVQLIENIYKIGVAIDYENIGKVLEPKGDFTGKERKFDRWEPTTNIDDNERKKRAKAVLDGIANLSDFAKQARNMVSFSPDIVIISLQNKYNHRLMRALDLDDNGKINKEELIVVLKDIKAMTSEIFVGYTPGVISKESESDFYEALKKGAGIEKNDVKTPFEAIEEAKNEI